MRNTAQRRLPQRVPLRRMVRLRLQLTSIWSVGNVRLLSLSEEFLPPEASMWNRGICRFLSAVALFGFALGLVLVPQRAASQSPQDANSPQGPADEAVPAYHSQASQGELPATMNPDLFTDPVVQNAYAVAAKIKKPLYKEPCYRHCDRSHGHTSLLDCFASKHVSACGTCINAHLYTFEQVPKSKTAA